MIRRLLTLLGMIAAFALLPAPASALPANCTGL